MVIGLFDVICHILLMAQTEKIYLEPAKKLFKSRQVFGTQFQGSIRRRSRLVTQWKQRHFTMVQKSAKNLTLIVRKSGKGDVEEVINLSQSSLSNECSVAEGRFSFGVMGGSQKTYLISTNDEETTSGLHRKICNLKREVERSSKSPTLRQLSNPNNQDRHSNQEPLMFEKCEASLTEKMESTKEEKQEVYQYQTPLKAPKFQEIDDQQELPRPEKEQTDYFETVIQMSRNQESVMNPETSMTQEIVDLASNKGFRLKNNFAEGRVMVKDKSTLKVDLLLKTQFSPRQVLQCLIRLELWNDRVRHFEKTNLEGKQVIKLELHRNGLLSLPRFTYLDLSNQGQTVVLRSVRRKSQQWIMGYSWIDLTLAAKVQAEENQMLLTVCLTVQPSDYSLGEVIVDNFKCFQAYLDTTKPPKRPMLST